MGGKISKNYPQNSEIKAECQIRTRLSNLIVLYGPCKIKLDVITEHHCSHAQPITIQPWIDVVFDLGLKGTVFYDVVTDACFRCKRRFTGPAGANVIESRELKIPEKVRCDRSVGQRANERNTEFGIHQHHAITKQCRIIKTAEISGVLDKKDILIFCAHSQRISLTFAVISFEFRLIEQPVVHSSQHE